MRDHAEKNGLSFIDELDLSTLGMFRSGWKDGPRSSAKKLERMRAFFRFAQRRNWISNNPAVELKAPKVTLSPTLPFNNEEMRRILTFCVPENVYVVGLMNTADRSLTMVDYALRRRFRFLTLRPAFDTKAFQQHLHDKNAPENLIQKIVTRLQELNH
jgi:site-specific recombinase XerD